MALRCGNFAGSFDFAEFTLSERSESNGLRSGLHAVTCNMAARKAAAFRL